MNNNEILIAVNINGEFEKEKEKISVQHYFCLLLEKKTTLKDLFYALYYGLEKDNENAFKYFEKYIENYSEICIEYNKIDSNLCPIIPFEENKDKSLDNLGFVSGSCIHIQEKPFFARPLFLQDVNSHILNDENNPLKFNINVRRINVIEDSKLEILSPPQMPQKDKTNFLERMLPLVMSGGAMMGLRFVAYPSGGSSMGNAMMWMSGGMMLVGILNAVVGEVFKKKKFNKDLIEWKENYENYINNIVIPKIQAWQESDIKYLNTTYPQIDKLFTRVSKIYEDIFSRSQNDNDFLRIRLGNSNEITSLFTIEYQRQENITYNVSYSYSEQEGKITITFVEFNTEKKIYSEPREDFKEKISFEIIPSGESSEERAERENRQSKLKKNAQYIVEEKDNKSKSIPAALTDIPYLFSAKTFKYLKSNKNRDVLPPLMLDLRTSGALGVIAKDDKILEKFIRHIIFELSYYHAPEDLQFVFFCKKFDNEKEKQDEKEIQNEFIENYKFLPHTNELFSDISQFVFDKESAAAIFTNLLNIMDERSKSLKKDDDTVSDEKLTQVVCVVFDDYDIKETGFSKYLPEVPKEGEPYVNKNGLTFIFLTHRKDDLPKYCGNIIELDNKKSSLRYNILNRETLNKLSTADTTDKIIEQTSFDNDYLFLNESKDSKVKYKDEFKKAYRQLSSIYYTKISENGQVPDMVTLFKVLGYKDTPTKEEVKTKILNNWGELNKSQNKIENNDITNNLCVAIGENEHGTVTLDLHEKADGPHMLTAGTTGSGKSETIITYLINLCYKFSPRDLQFLLVDMKGGGFSDRLEKLPHCVGAVTDTAGEDEGISAVYMLKRFLATLNAEIKRRKLLLKRLGVDNIDDYIRATRNIDEYRAKQEESILNLLNDDQKGFTADRNLVLEYLAHLVLVVDEFTELKRFSSESDDVDFIKEITTIARVGRTLGFHIILVSQNIEGAITDDIRVNSKARVCLKVATKEASKQMLDGRIDAAAPNMPLNGRAYLLVGTGSRFVYFQSAYTAANSNTNIRQPVIVKTVPNSGNHTIYYNSKVDNNYENYKIKKENKDTKKTTQLEFIRDIIISDISVNPSNTAFAQAKQIFLKPLKATKNKEETEEEKNAFKAAIKETKNIYDYKDKRNKMIVNVGRFDIPIVQQQSDFEIDLLESNVTLFGLSMSGKTTFLEVLINVLHMQYTPSQENIFILDFSNGLRKFDNYPLVAAYFDTSNEEYVKRMFNVLEKKLSENQEKIKTNYRDEENPPSHTTFIIDNINAFFDESQYSNYHERFLRLCRDGITKGITIVLTASSTKGLSHYLAYFKQKIAFNMPQEIYHDIFNKKVDEIGNTPCHGYANVTIKPKDITSSFQMNLPYEVQCLRPTGEEKNEIWDCNKFKENKIEKRYPIFPQNLLLKSLNTNILTFDKLNQDTENENENNQIISKIGLDYIDFKPIKIDLGNTRTIAIYGKKGFGKTNTLELLLDNITKSIGKENIDIVYYDDSRKSLEKLNAIFSGTYICENNRNIPQLISSLNSIYNEKLKLFVLQNKLLFNTWDKHEIDSKTQKLVSIGKGNSDYFKEVLERYIVDLDKKAIFIFSDVPRMNQTVAQNFNLLVQSAFLLDNIAEFISERGQRTVFGSMDVKELKQEYARCSLGDGYYYDIESDILKKLKFIKYEEN